jgi:cytosine/adenosine deaminase-related metal-dependent hydrolase
MLIRHGVLSAACAVLGAMTLTAQTVVTPTIHGTRPGRLVIRNAMVVEGNGTPAEGPKDIVVEHGTITQIVAIDPVAASDARRPARGGAEIDAEGKYVLPGFINLHAHVQTERAGKVMVPEYQMKLWLASGITTIRDVSSDTPRTLQWRAQSAAGQVMAPRIFVYARSAYMPMPRTAAEARARVRELKAQGVDGLKLFGMDRDLLAATLDEARIQGLRTAHHMAVEETTVLDDVAGGATSIEHWYGIPDAALPNGVQAFPAEFNYNDETHRFRYAGRLWREADPAKLRDVLEQMVKANVAWDPTLQIYEASRDVWRAQHSPYFADYLHPSLESFFKPNPANHGSFFTGWTSTDEAYWRENYRLWMEALRTFSRLGGLVGAGEDAGFIYSMYGTGFLRELELHQEAGFPTIKVIQHATANGARILGQPDRLGRVRVGYAADLVVVNGNPLADLKVLYPPMDDDTGRKGGIEFTVKDGHVYHAPTMLGEVREIVRRARAAGATSRR